MQTVSEIMTRNIRVVSPEENLQRAAQAMDELDVGALPVCVGERLVGMVTDRDITIRGVAAGKAPDAAQVNEVMSTDVRWVFEDQPLGDLMTQMADGRIRRIPVVSRDEQHRLVGIVSLGDVAVRTETGVERKQNVEEVLETVSSPSGARGRAAGRTGSGDAGAAADGAGDGRMAGTDMPIAGQNPRMAGAAGDPAEGRTGRTGEPRRNFGVSGQDLTGDGLPPH